MRRRGQTGAATLLTVQMAGLLLFVALALAGALTLVVDHRRAQAAADLAALAGASSPEGCAAAARISAANSARLASCWAVGADVVVTVTVDSRMWAGWTVSLGARARAGPG
jgi:secretion/DNA translocation related TadE-like protein